MENSFVKWTDLPAGPLWLTPPDLEPWQVEALARLRARVEPDPEMTWVFSSGTSGVDRVKCLGLTRAAHLASAAAVNRHLGATAADRWLLAIPSYHVGGFAIAARAHLAGSAVDTLPRWDAADFLARVELCGTTLCSLVPTQIFDLVATGRRAPPGLRAIVCGGGALDPALFRAARAAGWPVLPSYGLTETASQIATLALDADPATTPGLTVLDHAEVRLDEGRIEIRGPSVSGVRAVADRAGGVVIDDPRRDGWLLTEDLGRVDRATFARDRAPGRRGQDPGRSGAGARGRSRPARGVARNRAGDRARRNSTRGGAPI